MALPLLDPFEANSDGQGGRALAAFRVCCNDTVSALKQELEANRRGRLSMEAETKMRSWLMANSDNP